MTYTSTAPTYYTEMHLGVASIYRGLSKLFIKYNFCLFVYGLCWLVFLALLCWGKSHPNDEGNSGPGYTVLLGIFSMA